MRGVLKVIKKVKEDRRFAEKTLAKYVRTTNTEVLTAALDQQMLTLPDIPVPPREAIKTILDELAKKLPEAGRTAPDALIDSSVVREAAQHF